MDDVMIGSSVLGLRLRAGPPGDGIVGKLVVSVIAPGLSATSIVGDHAASGGVATYFEQMARDWRGWRDERTYRFLEGDCTVSAVHDGHVRLSVELGSADMETPWRVVVEITLDAGEQLSRAAQEIADLFRG